MLLCHEESLTNGYGNALNPLKFKILMYNYTKINFTLHVNTVKHGTRTGTFHRWSVEHMPLLERTFTHPPTTPALARLLLLFTTRAYLWNAQI